MRRRSAQKRSAARPRSRPRRRSSRRSEAPPPAQQPGRTPRMRGGHSVTPPRAAKADRSCPRTGATARAERVWWPARGPDRACGWRRSGRGALDSRTMERACDARGKQKSARASSRGRQCREAHQVDEVWTSVGDAGSAARAGTDQRASALRALGPATARRLQPGNRRSAPRAPGSMRLRAGSGASRARGVEIAVWWKSSAKKRGTCATGSVQRAGHSSARLRRRRSRTHIGVASASRWRRPVEQSATRGRPPAARAQRREFWWTIGLRGERAEISAEPASGNPATSSGAGGWSSRPARG